MSVRITPRLAGRALGVGPDEPLAADPEVEALALDLDHAAAARARAAARPRPCSCAQTTGHIRRGRALALSGYPDGMSKEHGPWRDGHRAWGRLREWQRLGPPGRPADDGERALATLADVGAVRRLLDEVELTAVRAGRQHGRSWAEIATKLGVSRQSAWERWRELDGPLRGDLTV